MSLIQEAQKKVAAKLWREVAQIPRIGAYFVRGGGNELDHVSVVSRQDDVDQDKTRKFLQPYVPHCGDWSDMRRISFPLEFSGTTDLFPSPSGQKLAVLREVVDDKEKSNEKKISSIEILDRNRFICSVTFPKLHGKIYDRNELGGFVWSRDETEVAYIAEAIPPKTASLFKPEDDDEEVDTETSEKKKDKPITGDEHLFRRDWGAGFVGVIAPKLFVFNLESKKSRQVKGIPNTFSVGQVEWSPDGRGIVFVGYSSPPRRLGICAHNTRPSKLYYIKVLTEAEEKANREDQKKKLKDEEAKSSKPDVDEGKPLPDDEDRTESLTPDDPCAVFPKFNPNGNKLAYFTTDRVQIHFSCNRLRMLDWTNRSIRTVVDIVRNPRSVDEFPGIFFYSLPKRIWSPDGRYLYIHSFWRSLSTLIRIDAETGEVRRISGPDLKSNGPGPGIVSALLADISESHLLCWVSDPVTPASIWLLDPAAFCNDIVDVKNSWTRVTTPYIPECIKDLSWEILQVDPVLSPKNNLHLGFEAVLVLPKTNTDDEGLPPLVLEPHGGPHGVYASTFDYHGNTFLNCLGFAMLYINFRGSLGFGQDMVESVLGTGQDADDCIDAAEVVLKKDPPVVNKDKLAVIGASHGGYLTCMIIGRWPNRFQAAVAHNPVTNIAAMSAMTDIPDWCYVESGLSWKPTEIPTAEKYKIMFENSPIAHVENVKTPILMLLGKLDVRVPLAQNIDYMNILKSRDVETRTLIYEKGTHGLFDTVLIDGDSNVNRALWLMKYLVDVDKK